MVDRYDGIMGMGDEGRFVRLVDYDELLAERDALAAQVEALKAYAERYLWMRRTFIADDESWPDDVAEANTGEQLDVAIDAAREGKK